MLVRECAGKANKNIADENTVDIAVFQWKIVEIMHSPGCVLIISEQRAKSSANFRPRKTRGQTGRFLTKKKSARTMN